jgi:hypothetical protein
MQHVLVGQSSSGMKVNTEVEDIVLIRQQTMTDVGTADPEYLRPASMNSRFYELATGLLVTIC